MQLEAAKILVVEDDPTMRSFLSQMLTQIGVVNVLSAADGQSALTTIVSARPDLVLSDIHMKPMGGLDMIRRLRAHPNHEVKNTKVLLMSSDSSPQSLTESLPLGILAYVIKPPQAKTLKAKLEQALKAGT